MNYPFTTSAIRLAGAAALAIATPFATASDVSWSVSVGSSYPAPRVYTPPPPAVVYVQPQPVYVRPRPVYVQPATVVQYGPPSYYVEEVRYKKIKRHHWKHHHHRHDYDY